jgi:pimeloyl-ACP methyl ester carboxylesterase
MRVLDNEITFRYHGGGGQARYKPLGSEEVTQIRSRLILLIHGYNTSQDDANAHYARFEDFLRRSADGWADDLCAVHWPGDESSRFASTLAYQSKVRMAELVGAALADFCAKKRTAWATPPRLIIVAHSLGCRLTLETLLQLAHNANSSLKVEVVLMAAAVPSSLVEAQGKLLPALSRVGQSLVLFSPADRTLQRPFTLMQARLGEPGEAVGLNGAPEESWTERREMPEGYGHRRYWKDPEVVNLIARWLGAPVMSERPFRLLPLYEIAEEVGLPDGRHLPGEPLGEE